MLPEKSIRWFIFHSPEELRKVSISKKQRLALCTMQSRGKITSHDFCSIGHCAVREASTLLKDLHEKGYAKRVKKPDPSGTGGFVYEYSLIDELKYEAVK